MRIVSVIREAMLTLLGSACGALLLFVSARELTRSPGLQNATLNGLVPITSIKFPWLVVIALVLVAVFLSVRSIAGQGSLLSGLWLLFVRAGFWWSMVALLLFIGVIAYGARTQSFSDLRWPVAAAYIAVAIPVLIAFGLGRARAVRSPSPPRSGAVADS